MGVEFEQKYRADSALLAAIRQAYPAGQTVIQMETTYYDTSDGALSAKRYTLRRRLENGVSVCTLKTPGGPEGRGEWEAREAAMGEALPRLAAMSGMALPPAEALSPVCGVRFTRTAIPIAEPSFTAELALDAGALLGGGRQAPFWEVELELKSGSREDMAAFGAALARKFGMEEEPNSKFRRALALAGGEKDV